MAAVALGVALVHSHVRTQNQTREYEASMRLMSNEWVQTTARLTEQRDVNGQLEKTLAAKTNEITAIARELSAASNQLSTAESQLTANAKAAEEESARSEARIRELEHQNDDVEKQMSSLTEKVTALNVRISETEHKLATAQGDKEFLLRELAQLRGEKAELERRFNDLAALRTQMRKLQDEYAVARRVDWMRRGVYGSDLKGGQRLQLGSANAGAPSDYHLDVNLEHKSVEPPAK